MDHITDNRACKIRDGHIGVVKHGEKIDLLTVCGQLDHIHCKVN